VTAETLAILGVTGDLAGGYLLPALATLQAEDLLPPDLEIIGVGREDWTDERFREHTVERLSRAGSELTPAAAQAFGERLNYESADVTDQAALEAVFAGQVDAGTPVIAYLALPHAVFAGAVDALAGVGLPAGSRLVVEKPFGQSEETARRLNEKVLTVVPEDHVFRVDHFLAKQTVYNVLGLRFANRDLRAAVERAARRAGRRRLGRDARARGPGGYYDKAGALQDMLQNHLLQLMSLVAMEPPDVAARERPARPQDRPPARGPHVTPEDVARDAVRGRYTAGSVDGREVPSYVDEPGVDAARGHRDVRAGDAARRQLALVGRAVHAAVGQRRSASGRREICLRFRPVPHLTFGADQPGTSNELRLTLDPDRVALGVNFNGIGDPFDVESAELATSLAPAALPPYSQVLLAALAGRRRAVDPRRRGRGVLADHRPDSRRLARGRGAVARLPGRLSRTCLASSGAGTG
jgi:glucose-6-phosphate 1-dehydrogenase